MAQVIEFEGGKLRVWEEGDRILMRCEREMSQDGLYKVWVYGNGGELLLGTLAPEGDRLVLVRSVWKAELYRCGCWPVRGARCRMVYPFGKKEEWYWEPNPQRYVDEETARAGEWCRMLCRREEQGYCLAIPLRTDCPIPLCALICLAAPRQVKGTVCLAWYFDAKGHPVFPAGGEKEGGRRSR